MYSLFMTRRSLSQALLLSAALSLNLLAMPAAIAQVTPTPDPKAVMMYNLGIQAYKQGSTEAAIIFFKRACDIDANLADAQYNLAVIYQTQHRYKDAIPRYEEVLRIKPSDADATFQLGCLLQECGRLNDARMRLSSIAPNSAHFPEAQRRLAQLNAQPAVAGQPPAMQPPAATQPVYQPPATPAYQTAAQPPAYSGAPTLAPPINDGTPVGQQQPVTPPATATYTGQPAYSYQAAAQPPAAQPPAETQVVQTPVSQPVDANAIAAQPVQPPAAQPPADDPSRGAPVHISAPPASVNPVPVMANTSLRVLATGFHAPAGLAFDKFGNLYVANYKSNSIERIASDGTRTQFASGNNVRGPIGLVCDESGNLYVANYDSGTITRVNPAGVATIIATGFKQPYYLTLDKDGNLYVSQQEDDSIVRITLPRMTASKAP